MIEFDDFLVESKQQSLNKFKDKSSEAKSAKTSKLPYEMTISGYKVFSSIHAQARAKHRRDDLSSNDWKKLFRNAVNHIVKNKLKNGSYLFYSKSFQQSVVVDLRGKTISVVTVHPRNASSSSGKQISMGARDYIVEQYLDLANTEYEIMESVEILDLPDISIVVIE